jgi:hypothetical protein
MRPVPKIPSFALVGQPNEGKTTVMSTLAEDDVAPVSAIPGETKRCMAYPVEVNGEPVLMLYDTPGFENAAEVLAWFEQIRTLPDPLATFISTFTGSGRFQQELELFKPLHEGAAAIYVADPSRDSYEIDEMEVEILRLAAVPRIGVINAKEQNPQFLEKWRNMMRRDFNHLRDFNGHTATFRDRIDLLEAARAVIQDWQGAMDRSIAKLKTNWDNRLRDVAGYMVEDVRRLMELRERETIQDAGDLDRAKRAAKAKMEDAVRKGETKFRGKVRSLFKHSKDRWQTEELLDLDIFDTEVWKFLGLDKWQLLVAGVGIGALIGGYIDAHLGGASMLLGTLFGAIAGGVLAWLVVDKAVEVKIPDVEIGGIRVPGRKLGGQHAEASILPQSNVLWIILDRYILYTVLCASWSHGKRDMAAPNSASKENEKRGFTSQWTKNDRGKVMDFVGHLRRSRRNQEKLDQADLALRELLFEKLRELTTR